MAGPTCQPAIACNLPAGTKWLSFSRRNRGLEPWSALLSNGKMATVLAHAPHTYADGIVHDSQEGAQTTGTKMGCPGKWKHGPKPAEPPLINLEPHPNERNAHGIGAQAIQCPLWRSAARLDFHTCRASCLCASTLQSGKSK